MRKENNGQCREKNKKLRKIKKAGESDRTPFNHWTQNSDKTDNLSRRFV